MSKYSGKARYKLEISHCDKLVITHELVDTSMRPVYYLIPLSRHIEQEARSLNAFYIHKV